MHSLCLQVVLAGSRPGEDAELGLHGSNWHVYHMHKSGVRCSKDCLHDHCDYTPLQHTCYSITRLVNPFLAALPPCRHMGASRQLHRYLLLQDTELQWRRGDVTLTQLVHKGNWLSMPSPEIKVLPVSTPSGYIS